MFRFENKKFDKPTHYKNPTKTLKPNQLHVGSSSSSSCSRSSSGLDQVGIISFEEEGI
jgi:hypothetical protein